MSRFENIKEFAEGVKAQLIEFLPNKDTSEYSLSVIEVPKINGIILTGIVINEGDNVLSPTLYMDDYFTKWQAGEYISFRSILKDVAKTYEECITPEDFDISNIKDFEKAKERITRRLVSFDKNQELLESMPYKKYENLAVIYQIEVGNLADKNETATVKLTGQMMEYYGLTIDELDAIAKENTLRIHPTSIMDLDEVMFREVKEYIKNTFEVGDKEAREIFDTTYDVPSIQAIYVGNDAGLYGAVAILDESVQDIIAERFGDLFVVIPSSVHEVLVLPFEGDFNDYHIYEGMISSVNEECLKEGDYLSDKVYIVDAQKHILLQMDQAEENFKELEKKEMVQEDTLKEENVPQTVNATPQRHRLR